MSHKNCLQIYFHFAEDVFWRKFFIELVDSNLDIDFINASSTSFPLRSNLRDIPLNNILHACEDQNIRQIYSWVDITSVLDSKDMNHFYLVFDRVFIKPISQWRKNFIIVRLINYWVHVIGDREKVLINFFHTPHFPWDYALFVLSRLSPITRIKIFRKPAIDNFFFLNTDITLSESTFVPAPQPAEYSLLVLNSSNQSAYLNRSIRLNRKHAKSSLKLKSILNREKLKHLYKYLKSWLSPLVNRNYYFNLSFIEYLRFKVGRYFLKRKASQWMAANSRDSLEGMGRRYVVFFMHFRPERTTIPEGGRWSDQCSAILELSKLLPPDVALLVKEHPRMISDTIYAPEIRCSNFHYISDYIFINSIPNVEFISPFFSSADLIKGSVFVASITGSVLWEALAFGCPSLSFGETWHSSCLASPSFESVPSNSLFEYMERQDAELVLKSKEIFLKSFAKFLVMGVQDIETLALYPNQNQQDNDQNARVAISWIAEVPNFSP